MSNPYLELRARHQKEHESLPVIWAYSDTQLTEGLKKLNADIKEIVSVGCGGYMRKVDVPALEELLQRHETEREAHFDDEEYLYKMFMYELGNHEYCITQEVDPTLDACGITQEHIKAHPAIGKMLKKAVTDYMALDHIW